MFAKQYFAHISPSGVGASDLAEKNGYHYIAIGENIAMGNFENDKALVDAWMASPGHRANILNARYREIGIAVGPGTFAASEGGDPRQGREGRKTWIGVQVFGLSLSACPEPDSLLKARIDNEKGKITDLENAVSALRDKIKSSELKTKEEVAAYNQKVDAYNILVNQLNAFVADVKSTISEYNAQVEALNTCIAG